MSLSSPSQNVEEYINHQPVETQQALRKLRQFILEAAPEATELINYEIPSFALIKDGKRDQQIMIAGHKKHVGFYPHPTTIAKFEPELKNTKHSKGAVQFPINQPLPKELIIRMVTYRKKLLEQEN